LQLVEERGETFEIEHGVVPMPQGELADRLLLA
jgi:hypothetical protein